MTALRWVGFAAGVALALFTWSSVIRTLVVPRATSSWLARNVAVLVRRPILALARQTDDYEVRDRLLAPLPPVVLLMQLISWISLFILAFALMLWPTLHSFPQSLKASGSDIFTLGYVPATGLGATVVSFLAGASGVVVIALQVGYLPTIYGAFNRRETLVTLLQSRAGEPAWGPELLARHQIVGSIGNLPGFYADWERWAADVTESHTNYPALIFFRSPHPRRNWVVGLLAVLDSAAIYLAACPTTAPLEARMCLRMGFTCLRDIAKVLRIDFDEDPRPDASIQLTYEEFEAGIARLTAVGFEMERSAEEAWPHFRGWRVNYEPQAYAIARAVDAVPSLWSGTRWRSLPPISPIRPPNRTPEQPHGR